MDPRADQERLRLRLYAPGATQADVEAYRATEPGALPEPDGIRARARRGLVLRSGAAGAGIALAIVGIVAVVVAHPFAPAPVPTSSIAEVEAGELAVPEAARAGFLRAFDAGEDPQLLTYLDAHPRLLLTRLRGAGRPDSTGLSGIGPATVALSPTNAAERSGRVTVVLLVDRSGRYDWQATRVAMENDRSGPEPPVAEHAGTARAGVPVSGTVVYSSGVPTRLTMLLPTGMRWAAVVVYSG